MYLLMSEREKIILETVKELEKYDLENYKVYTLSPVDSSELVTDGEIRDKICCVLKGNQMTKNEVMEEIAACLDIPKSKISKVITKMKKEKMIYDVNDWNYLGERFIGMD